MHKAELAKLKANLEAEMAKQKSTHEAEVAKLLVCHEEELEKAAVAVLEARKYAQKVQRTHQFAKRNYERAKTSSALQAEHMKAMESEEKRWIKFLKEMDEQLSHKFFLRLLSEADFLRFILMISSIGLFSQELSPLPMHGPLKLSKCFGRTKPKRPQIGRAHV